MIAQYKTVKPIQFALLFRAEIIKVINDKYLSISDLEDFLKLFLAMDKLVECKDLNNFLDEDFNDGFESTKLDVLDNRLVFINSISNYSVAQFLTNLKISDYLIISFIEKVKSLNWQHEKNNYIEYLNELYIKLI